MIEELSEGLVLCVSGPSGVGKGTVIQALLERHPDFHLSISMTTRQPRGQEKDGEDYYFCDKDKFESLIEAKEILEYDLYNNEYYGTPVGPIRQFLKEGRDVVLDITLAGSLQIQKLLPETVMVFLLPPSLEELKERLVKRQTESNSAIEARLHQAEIEMLHVHKFEYALINDKIEDTVDSLEAIVLAEKCRYRRQRKSIDKILANLEK